MGVNRKDFLAINFYKKTAFIGSYKNMHYRIKKVTKESEEGNTDVFLLTYWPGPLCLDKTDDELKQEMEFPFGEEGLVSIADYLNEQYEKQKELWESVVIK